jgi:signal transduction histidine kinase/CheY-like chemotaxis protein
MMASEVGRDALRKELARLRQELEQAQVALEDTQADIAALSAERDNFRRLAAAHADARHRAEDLVRQAQQQTKDAVIAAAAYVRTTDGAEAEELRMSLEETSVLAEELLQANQTLSASNAALDRRVAERTAALDCANARLERLNADLQHRVESETAARAAAQTELFKLQKLDAVGQLTGGISHDFNNLLTVIISGLQLLGQVQDPSHRARVLRRVEDAAWRGARLTQRLLAFARRQPLHADWLDLAHHMDTIRELLTHGLRENISVRDDVDAGLWPVEVDVAALELALLNLAVNARDAMPRGGSLVISARNVRLPADRAARFDVADGDYVELGVADTGTGMRAELLERVFEPFFTTKAEGKGTGLGLAQVYGFAKQSGGSAWVESAPNQGTVVRLLLPRSLRPAPSPAMIESPRAAVIRQREKLKMLVVEDDDNVAALVLDMLAELGHSGTRVGTVASALAVLNGAEAVDLVFSDVLLPGGDSGLDLVREMVRRQIAVPMILTSGYGGGMTQRLAAANLPFLPKPYRIETLRQTIEEALARQPANPHV